MNANFVPRSTLKRLSRLLSLIVLAALAPRAAAADGDELFSSGVPPHLRIEISSADMRVLRSYRQEKGQPRPPRVDVRATVREGNQVYTNVAVHLKGSWSFQPVDAKPSLTLNFNKFAPGQKFHGLGKIHLNNSAQDGTYLHEALARTVFNEAGVPAARAGHATVSLNESSRGLYVLVEGMNKQFVKRHFKSDSGNLYDGGSAGEIGSPRLKVTSGDRQEDRSDLARLLAAAREADPAKRFARLDQLLDVDRFLTFAALEVLFAHWDGYCNSINNYHVFHDAESRKMVFMPHGLDQILEGGRSISSRITPQSKGAVARGLLTTGEGQRRYLERFNDVFTNHFQTAQLNAKVDRIAQRINATAGFGMWDALQFKLACRNLKSRISQRVDQVTSQLSQPEKPVPFSADGTLRLRDWRFKNGTTDTAAGRTAMIDGREVLEVRAGGPGSSGSWRKTVPLPPGRYEFTGLAKAVGLVPGVPSTGVLLRISGERSVEGISSLSEWAAVKYEFTTETAGSFELICEFRGPQGAGLFDLSSLKLQRR